MSCDSGNLEISIRGVGLFQGLRYQITCSCTCPKPSIIQIVQWHVDLFSTQKAELHLDTRLPAYDSILILQTLHSAWILARLFHMLVKIRNKVYIAETRV
jgi:hypothetical protein